ncbi:hypothetical protein [Trinickia soli]|uniref:hypothetical protein n=1 Tax=Trinickia soli TaxID=380675 RepID=UPI0011AEF73F|nr:hypothetical protein [Trinickia soli]CAB3670818.1 hypothetical protein LMG24076_01931 [Trinickia soli]
MDTPYEVEGTASRWVDHADNQGDDRAQPSNRTASVSGALSPCAANFPMLTPHEIATLMLIARTPGQVSIEWPDLLPLLSGNLVQIDKCRRCKGKPLVTPLGESLVVRLCMTSRRASERHIPTP